MFERVKFFPISRSTAQELARLDQLSTEIKALSGYSLEEIRGMLMAGYTLQPPEQIRMDEWSEMLRSEVVESM